MDPGFVFSWITVKHLGITLHVIKESLSRCLHVKY